MATRSLTGAATTKTTLIQKRLHHPKSVATRNRRARAMDVLPATPVPTGVKGRARARLAELRIMIGWNSESPITISKPKSGGTERGREAMNKRMRNMGFWEVADERGFSTAKALAEELDYRVFTEGQDKKDYKKLMEEMKQEQARHLKALDETGAKWRKMHEEPKVMEDRNEMIELSTEL